MKYTTQESKDNEGNLVVTIVFGDMPERRFATRVKDYNSGAELIKQVRALAEQSR